MTVGAAVLGPELTLTYALAVVPGEMATVTGGGPATADPRYQTVRRQLAALGVGPPLLARLGAAVLAPPLAVLYRLPAGRARATCSRGSSGPTCWSTSARSRWR